MQNQQQPWGLDASREVAAPPRSAAHRLLGGPPVAVAVRLLFVSIVVGALLMWLRIEPFDLFRALARLADRLWAEGFAALGQVGTTLVAGAAVVLPVWLVLRLLSLGGSR